MFSFPNCSSQKYLQTRCLHFQISLISTFTKKVHEEINYDKTFNNFYIHKKSCLKDNKIDSDRLLVTRLSIELTFNVKVGLWVFRPCNLNLTYIKRNQIDTFIYRVISCRDYWCQTLGGDYLYRLVFNLLCSCRRIYAIYASESGDSIWLKLDDTYCMTKIEDTF